MAFLFFFMWSGKDCRLVRYLSSSMDCVSGRRSSFSFGFPSALDRKKNTDISNRVVQPKDRYIKKKNHSEIVGLFFFVLFQPTYRIISNALPYSETVWLLSKCIRKNMKHIFPHSYSTNIYINTLWMVGGPCWPLVQDIRTGGVKSVDAWHNTWIKSLFPRFFTQTHRHEWDCDKWTHLIIVN